MTTVATTTGDGDTDELRTVVGGFREKLLDVLKRVIITRSTRDPVGNQEVEVRIGYHEPRHFVTNLGRETHARLLRFLHSNPKWSNVKKGCLKDYFSSERPGIRLTEAEEDEGEVVDDDNNKKWTCVRKLRREVWDFPFYSGTNYGVRISWSMETPVGTDHFGDGADYVRRKARHSFTHANRYDMTWRYDATIVESIGDSDGDDVIKDDDIDKDEDMGDTSYDFELEILLDDTKTYTDSELSYLAHSTQLKVDDVLKVVADS